MTSPDVLFQQADVAMEVLCAKLSFEKATVRLRNLELETSVQSFVFDDFSTLEFQFLAQLENSEKRAHHYLSILLESQKQLSASKTTEETLKGSLQECELKLEQLRVASELAKKEHQEVMEKTNEQTLTIEKKQLKRKEAELKRMRKDTEAEKKRLEAEITSVQDHCHQLEEHNKELHTLVQKEQTSRKSLHMNMKSLESDKDKRMNQEAASMRKSLRQSVAFRLSEPTEDIIPEVMHIEDEKEIIDFESADATSEAVSDDDSSWNTGGEDTSDDNEELIKTKISTPLPSSVGPIAEDGVMTRARRRETIGKKQTDMEDFTMAEEGQGKIIKRHKPPYPSRLFQDPMAACNEKVREACEEHQNPDILAVNPFVIPLPAQGPRRPSGQGAKRKLGPRSATSTAIPGSSEFDNKELQGGRTRSRKAQNNPLSKKWHP